VPRKTFLHNPKLSFDLPIIFEISQSEISKMMGRSKQFSAAEGGE